MGDCVHHLEEFLQDGSSIKKLLEIGKFVALPPPHTPPRNEFIFVELQKPFHNLFGANGFHPWP